MDSPRTRPRSRGQGLTVEEMQERARQIRDVFEPDIARNGSNHLAPDMVLDLAQFWSKLLHHSLEIGRTVRFATPGGSPSTPSAAHQVTLADLQQSRIHRALLLITGRGTRWPRKLVEQCDLIVAIWADIFGPMENIRPLLYEKGGRLAGMMDERDLSRHALLVKWLSDPKSPVSPLQAMENGHLDFRPGHWWIHPIFAFRAGIIDSPDPHGGVTTDVDGVYAITLTGYDELKSEDANLFTYRIRKSQPSPMRLCKAMSQPKLPIRILRSHTLRSIWSPVAGIRYDGLYKVMGWGMSMDRDKKFAFTINLQREPVDAAQPPMAEVRKCPRSEDVDDYIEYKRLRELRQKKAREGHKRNVPKHDQLLGIITPLHEIEATPAYDDDELSITSGARRSAQFGVTKPDVSKGAVSEEVASPTGHQNAADYFSMATSLAKGPGWQAIGSPAGRQHASDYFSSTPGQLDGTMSKLTLRTDLPNFKERIFSSCLSSPDAYSPDEEQPPPSLSPETPATQYHCSCPEAHTSSPETPSVNMAFRVENSPSSAAFQQWAGPTRIQPCDYPRFEDLDLSREKREALKSRKDRSSGDENMLPVPVAPSASSARRGSTKIGLRHEQYHELFRQMRHLYNVSLARGLNRRFYEELGGILSMVERWQLEDIQTDGMVPSCLFGLADEVRSIRECGKVEWESAGGGEALDDFLKRHEARDRTKDPRTSPAADRKPSWHQYLDPNLAMDEHVAGAALDVDKDRQEREEIENIFSPSD